MKVATRAFAAYVLTFVVCTPVALANGLDLVAALRSSAIVASIACALVALLALGLENAEAKGYPGWVGLLLVIAFNVVGLIVLALLPRKPASL